MKIKRLYKVGAIVLAIVVLLVIAGLIGASGCGDEGEAKSASYDVEQGMWLDDGADSVMAGAAEEGIAMDEIAALAPEAEYRETNGSSADASIQGYERGEDQKIIKNAILDIEVETGTFQSQFDKAQQLASLFGGYVLSSSSTASGEEDTIKSGSVSISVPVDSFDEVIAEAKKLGAVKYEYTDTDTVTDEYVDLQARITNQQAYVNSLLALLAKAETVQEILQVQQTVSSAQQVLEQLKGRLQYLDAHTSFSTLTMNIYESGTEVTPPEEEWGFVQALKDAAHNLVDAFSAVVKGLGWLIPVLVIVGVLVGIIYVTVKSAKRVRRNKTDRED